MATLLTETNPKRRDKLVIIAEILDIARDGTSKTHIMIEAALSFSQLNQYLPILVRTGLLEKTVFDSREIYRSSQKGLEFMEKQCQIINLLNEGSRSHVKTSFEFKENPNCKGLRITHSPFSNVFTVKHH